MIYVRDWDLHPLEFQEDGPATLTLRATCRVKDSTGRRRLRGPVLEQSTGADGTGPALDADARDYLLSTYLKPLRDAETELSGGRYSRLSQILAAYPTIRSQAAKSESDLPDDALLKIFRGAEDQINAAPILQAIQKCLNDKYLSELSFPLDKLSSSLGIGKKADLRQILDKLELWLTKSDARDERTRHGLGYNNILFMATELLLLGADDEAMPLLLIEEPEAHLHPQLQIRLMNFLMQRCSSQIKPRVQAIVTTHSPNLACSAPVDSLTMVTDARTYSLAEGKTKLTTTDYEYLHRFLDATKSSMLFARGVLIVEGDAENILLPTLANVIGTPLEKSGVAIVNVGHRGLFRFANVFRRADGTTMPIPVACLHDKDERPAWARSTETDTPEEDDEVEEAPAAESTEATSNVREFHSPHWTFEYDLAMHGLAREVYLAVREAGYRANRTTVSTQLRQKWEDEWTTESATRTTPEGKAEVAYKRLHKAKASKAIAAQCLASLIAGDASRNATVWRELLPTYIVEAIGFVTKQPSDDGPTETSGAHQSYG